MLTMPRPRLRLFLFSIMSGCYFLGDLFLKFALGDNERFDNLPARLAFGVILANVLLYLAILILPFGPCIGWWIIFAAGWSAGFCPGGVPPVACHGRAMGRKSFSCCWRPSRSPSGAGNYSRPCSMTARWQ